MKGWITLFESTLESVALMLLIIYSRSSSVMMSFATSSGIAKSSNPEDGLWLNMASYGVSPRLERCVVFF